MGAELHTDSTSSNAASSAHPTVGPVDTATSLERSNSDDLSASYMKGPNREFGPSPLEGIYCQLGRLEPLLKTFRLNSSLPDSLESIGEFFNGTARDLGELYSSCRKAQKCLREDSQPRYEINTLCDAANKWWALATGVTANSSHFMGFPREAVPHEAVLHFSRYVRFLCSVLDNVGETAKIIKGNTTAQGAEKSVVASLLTNGIVPGTYARYLSGERSTLGCDGSSGRFFTKDACVCWHDNREVSDTNEDFALYLAKREASFEGGEHSPLAVSAERPSEDIGDFPSSVDTRELERRLNQSALVVLYLSGECKSFDHKYLQNRDPVMFNGMDAPSVWMSSIVPPDHIYRILVPAEKYDEVIQHVPEPMRDKVSAVRGTCDIDGGEFDYNKEGAVLSVPNFQAALESCVREIEAHHARANAHQEATPPMTIGVHATRLAQ